MSAPKTRSTTTTTVATRAELRAARRSAGGGGSRDGGPPTRTGRKPKKPPTKGLNVSPVLRELMDEMSKRAEKQKTDKQTAGEIGILPGRFCQLRAGTHSPTLEELHKLCDHFDVPLERFFAGQSRYFAEMRDGLRWTIRRGLVDRYLAQVRDVARATLRGGSLAEIAKTYRVPSAACADGSLEVARESVLGMVRGALARGLVEVSPAGSVRDLEDEPLARELEAALRRWRGDERPLEVRVVKNLACADFQHDPLAPYLMSFVAHSLVRRHLAEHATAHTIGIAGGLHVAAFVRSIGPETSPFPDPSEAGRHFTLVPLTLEPFYDHKLELADALGGELHAIAAALLGGKRVAAPSLKPFGYLENGTVGKLEKDSVVTVRAHYPVLDVAVFGCGDRSDDGWLAQTRMRLGSRIDEAATDVCLNMLSDLAEPIDLPSNGSRREYLGVSLEHIRSVARRRDRLAVVLGSGRSKGVPITLVVRAGCANAVVCDQAAARAAIEASGRPRPAAAKAGAAGVGAEG